MIRAAKGERRFSNSTATDHLLYIEREGAAEMIEKPQKDTPYG
jgi:hypothetical protein